MSFVRPEAAQKLLRWREAISGAAATLLGSYWMVTQTGALRIIGTVLCVGGALLVFAGIQRARFRRGADGAGVVQVDEGQLTYFGPIEGGALAVEDITRLDLVPARFGDKSWMLWHRNGPPLTIPANAAGADALFDVFATLPGLKTQDILKALNTGQTAPVTLWDASPRVWLH